MIDLHCHIIFEVDDGARSMEDSIKMIMEAKKAGYSKIIATPHYMEEHYIVPKEQIKAKVNLLNKALQTNNIDIELIQGNEIYITKDIVNLIKSGEVSTINNSKYVLFETPISVSQEPINLVEVVYTLLENGYIPIVAHPERYIYIQKNPNRLFEMIQDGVLFQANLGSILGQYGKESKEVLIKMLENNMIHFFGTDAHRPGSIYTKVEEAIEELNKILPKEKVNKLLHENAQLVLENKDIDIEMPTKIKESSGGLFKKLFK